MQIIYLLLLSLAFRVKAQTDCAPPFAYRFEDAFDSLDRSSCSHSILSGNSLDAGAVLQWNGIYPLYLILVSNSSTLLISGGLTFLNMSSITFQSVSFNQASIVSDVSYMNFTAGELSITTVSGTSSSTPYQLILSQTSLKNSVTISNCSTVNMMGTQLVTATFTLDCGGIIQSSSFTASSLTVSDSVAISGGMFYFSSVQITGGSSLLVSDVKFSGNIVKDMISSAADTSKIVRCSFTGNAITFFTDVVVGKSLNIYDSSFTNNALDNGQGIVYGGTLNMRNVSFTNNDITNGFGGAVVSTVSVNTTRCYFKNNRAVAGGAMYVISPLNDEGSTFEGNQASLGGAIYGAVGLVTLHNSIFIGNYATNSSAAIVQMLDMKNCTFRNHNNTLSLVTIEKSLTADGCTFDSNQLSLIKATSGTFSLSNSIVSSTNANGADLLMNLGFMSIDNCTFSDIISVKSETEDMFHRSTPLGIINTQQINLTSSRFLRNDFTSSGSEVMLNGGGGLILHTTFNRSNIDSRSPAVTSTNGQLTVQTSQFNYPVTPIMISQGQQLVHFGNPSTTRFETDDGDLFCSIASGFSTATPTSFLDDCGGTVTIEQYNCSSSTDRCLIRTITSSAISSTSSSLVTSDTSASSFISATTIVSAISDTQANETVQKIGAANATVSAGAVYTVISQLFANKTSSNPTSITAPSLSLIAYDTTRGTINSTGAVRLQIGSPAAVDSIKATAVISLSLLSSLTSSRRDRGESPPTFVIFMGYNYSSGGFRAPPANLSAEVYGLTISRMRLVSDSPENIKIDIPTRGVSSVEQLMSLSCLFYNVTTDTWSADGCDTERNFTSYIVTCRCNHLTNFTVGASPVKSPSSASSNIPLIIGVVIGSVALLGLVAIIVFIVLRRRRYAAQVDMNEIPMASVDTGYITIEEKIATGDHSTVYRGLQSGTTHVAVKKMMEGGRTRENTLRSVSGQDVNGDVSIVYELLEYNLSEELAQLADQKDTMMNDRYNL
ncbi:membrane-anchored cell surface protein [Planoprotostelium fungivorum]|uniref:Membrane-anchored cell surface protein n=1 Tax=Planoprotostelium fungivorum TaxID=1890364 RepID=A0A2P6NLC9_9EUKA|nr:membrane-anchored cell surface protein [Planoprotostelium fungivorum]